MSNDCPRYVLLFPFDDNGCVLLKRMADDCAVRALRGKWNGWGGKIEEGDASSHAAARREGREELGVDAQWRLCGNFGGGPIGALAYEVAVFAACRNDWERSEHLALSEPAARTLCSIGQLPILDIVPNLDWLIPLAYAAVKQKQQPSLTFWVHEGEGP